MNTRIYKKHAYAYFIVAAIVGVINVAFIENNFPAMLVILIECVILFLSLFLRKQCTYYSLLIVFSSLCIESSLYAGSDTFYNLKNTRVLGMNLVIWLLVIFLMVSSVRKIRIAKNIFVNIRWFVVGMLLLIAIGTVLGLFNILIDDNDIRSIPSYWGEYISVFYTMALFPLLFMLATLICYFSEPEQTYKIKLAILAAFFGVSIQIIFSTLTGHRIRIAGLDGIGVASSLIIFYIPLAICAYFYKELIPKALSYIYLSIVSLGTVVALSNNANGKLIILLLMVPFIICALVERSMKFVFVMLAIILALFFVIFILPGVNTQSNYLLSSKIEDVSKLFNIFSKDWLINMPASPKYRILELVNTVVEFVKKPWCIPFGKGYLGSIRDHVRMFVRVGGDFSDLQWTNGSFYFLHESFNLLLLNNGIWGIFFWVKTLRFGIKHFKKSFFVLFGCIWFCLTYGYSVTITGIGMTAIIIGLFDVTNKFDMESSSHEHSIL